jgi:hypothetical protein
MLILKNVKNIKFALRKEPILLATGIANYKRKA